MKKNILIISFTNLNSDSRVKRQIEYLSKFYNVTTVGLKPAKNYVSDYFEIRPERRSSFKRIIRAVKYKMHFYDELYWGLYDFKSLTKQLKGKDFNLIIANDVETLPFVYDLFTYSKVLLDTHEYSPKHFEDQFLWRFFFQDYSEYICRKYLKKCNKIVTVSKGVANEYKKNYYIDSEIITNATHYRKIKPTSVDEKKIRIITHGLANKNRRLEFMIEIMDEVDERFHLDLMLVPVEKQYYNYLKKLVSKRNNVSLIAPVKVEEIITFTNKYDLSFLIFKPYTVNFKYGLGNKTFESLQARLGLVTGISPEPQAEIVNKYGCGIVLDSFEPQKIALQLNELTVDDIIEFKKKSNIAASELTSVNNMKKLHEIVKQLI